MASQVSSRRGRGSGSRFRRGSSYRGGSRESSHEDGTGQGICRTFQQNGSCRYGSACRFSHPSSLAKSDKRTWNGQQPRPQETPEQQKGRDDYNAWKRLIRTPPSPHPNNEMLMRDIWSDALAILEGGEREWKQMVPKDLDNEEYFGRLHIKTLMEKRARPNDDFVFVRLIQPFLSVITHDSLLDCLSVDTYVGGLYNFIAGTNGARAMPFFQHVCEALAKSAPNTGLTALPAEVDTTITATTTALRELLRREARARFNDDLPVLIDTAENTLHAIARDIQSPTITKVLHQLDEIRAIVAGAKGLLPEQGERQQALNTIASTSSYTYQLEIPRNRHDNDRTDITEIKIFPTREEIVSEEAVYLPSTNPDQPHFLTDQAARLIDTHFRLFRHDTFGELNDLLGNLATAEDNAGFRSRLDIGDFRAHQYGNAHISYISLDSRRGLRVNISFTQPAIIRKKTITEKQNWWEASKRLTQGVLLSFISREQNEFQHLFLIVADRTTDPKQNYGLASKGPQATITTQLASYDQLSIQSAIRLSRHKVQGLLVEYPGILPATFTPILENLQDMRNMNRLPFRQWIVPDRIDGGHAGEMKIPPPRYARGSTFSFSLKPLLRPAIPDVDDILIHPTSLGAKSELIDKIEAHTSLDRGQCQALIAALTREFAFIQGPPGTGKSYLGLQLMKVLLQPRMRAELGPVVVVCYTNHALDQFLEHLHENGFTNIVRIGGQSQLKLLEDHNLQRLSQREAKTRFERYELAKNYEDLDREGKGIGKALGVIHGTSRRMVWGHLKAHLSRRYRRIHAQFDRVDSDGYNTVGRDPLEQWAFPVKSGPMTEPQSEDRLISSEDAEPILRKAEVNVNALSQEERRSLVGFWSQEIYDIALHDLFEGVERSNATHKQITNIHDEVDKRVLRQAHVIGITTTGLAKRISALKHIACKVVICEEAGEVMEAHMISAMLPSVEHFIQIGDHQQLRPQINNFVALSLESKQGALYKLDRSQFERLSVGESGRPRMPIAQLNVQRRMRPEISILVRNTIYPKLVDHQDTMKFPNVVGMRKNVFWLDHNHPEEGQHSEMHHKSHSNIWEVQMVHALIRHIVRQGVYDSREIAVLTPYTGQLQLLRSALQNDYEVVLSERDQDALDIDGFNDELDALAADNTEDVVPRQRRAVLEKKKLSELLRIATVDNFQGEEAKIIIISLVRSNRERKVGFLRTTNRINVLLSRAQHGMYLIGNVDTYVNVPMWQNVVDMLQAAQSVGTFLALCCPRHEDTPIQVSEPNDFSMFSPEGGCRLSCSWRLPGCGHKCQAKCHSESMHDAFSCPQPCQRHHEPCKHACQKPTCGDDCGKCCLKLNDVELPCGHLKDAVLCHVAQNLGAINCNTLVAKKVPGCDHTVKVACSLDVTSDHFRCSTPCTKILSCGHVCQGTCGKCNSRTESGTIMATHQKCLKKCKRPFASCHHTCRKECHNGEDCGPCLAPCEVRCQHSKCMLRCHEACAPCVEPCTWVCEHQGQCTMPCAAPCNRLPCDKRCAKDLLCGHQCPGICGEVCPEKYCQQCSMKLDARVDVLEMKTYAEIDVGETPIAVLGCGHFFTAETLDGLMSMRDVYVSDEFGNFTGFADISGAMAGKVPQCPDCQLPVRQYVTQRYNRVINRAVNDEMSKRFLVSGQRDLKELEGKVDELESEVEGSRSARGQATFLGNAVEQDHTRQRRSQALQKEIESFLSRVADRHQPAHKLHAAQVHAVKVNKEQPLDTQLASMGLHHAMVSVEFDRRITLGGRMIQIRAECITLEDKLNVKASNVPKKSTQQFFKTCTAFIGECHAENLHRLVVESSLSYARLARVLRSSSSSVVVANNKASNSNDAAQNRMGGVIDYVNNARELLEKAIELCYKQPFQHAEELKKAATASLKLLGRDFYEEITVDELASIKSAMVSSRLGIATHSGHWYNCINGHPFAIGECGMPMEQARCPECGAAIGGSNHQPVQGVTRATQMER